MVVKNTPEQLYKASVFAQHLSSLKCVCDPLFRLRRQHHNHLGWEVSNVPQWTFSDCYKCTILVVISHCILPYFLNALWSIWLETQHRSRANNLALRISEAVWFTCSYLVCSNVKKRPLVMSYDTRRKWWRDGTDIHLFFWLWGRRQTAGSFADQKNVSNVQKTQREAQTGDTDKL